MNKGPLMILFEIDVFARKQIESSCWDKKHQNKKFCLQFILKRYIKYPAKPI